MSMMTGQLYAFSVNSTELELRGSFEYTEGSYLKN